MSLFTAALSIFVLVQPGWSAAPKARPAASVPSFETALRAGRRAGTEIRTARKGLPLPRILAYEPKRGVVPLEDHRYRDLSWADWAADRRTKNTVRRETEGFLRNWRTVRAAGGNAFKAILIEGAPGSGKTFLHEVLFSQWKDEAAFIRVSGKTLAESDVAAVFRSAREKRPAVVMLEHLKLSPSATRALLDQMSGPHDNSGVLVIGSNLELGGGAASLLRSGRFDTIIELPPLGMAQRLELLLRLTRSVSPFPAGSLERIARRTDGFTGAELETLVSRSIAAAAEEGSGDSARRVKILPKHLNRAFRSLAPAKPSPAQEAEAPPVEEAPVIKGFAEGVGKK